MVGGEGREGGGEERRPGHQQQPGSPAPRDQSINPLASQAKPSLSHHHHHRGCCELGWGKRRGAPALRWWSPCSGIWGTRPTPPPPYWLGEYLILHPVLNLFALNFLYHFIITSFPSDHLPRNFLNKILGEMKWNGGTTGREGSCQI